MATRTIETKAIISAEDKTGTAFAAVVQHMAKMEEAARRAQGHMKFSDAAERQARNAAREEQRSSLRQERAMRREIAMEARQRRLEERQARREEAEHVREVRKLHHDMEHHGIRRYVAEAAVTAVAAHSIVEVMKETAAAGAERQHIRVGMQNAGMKPDEIARAEISAINASKSAPNMSVSEIMELHKEARSAVQKPEEVFHLIPKLAQAASVLKGMGVQNTNIGDIVKAGETLSLMNDPKRFETFLDSQVRAMNVMGKTITTEQIYEAAKYTKSAGAALSDDFLNLTLPSLIQDMHGSSAGDALSMLTKTLRGGLQHKHLPVEKLNEIGMLEDPSKIRRSKSGQIMGYAGKVVGDQLLAEHPDLFAKIFNEHAEAHGIKTLSDKIKLLNETLPATAANVIRILIQQEETLKQHRANYLAAPGLDEGSANQLNDASVAVGNLAKSFNDLGASVTGPAMATIGTTLSSIAGGVRSLAAAAQAHPLAAMTGGAVVAGGAVAGSGYMAYKLATGFGLTTAATQLEGAAVALTAAAARLSGEHGIAGGAPEGSNGKGPIPNLAGRGLPGLLGLIADLYDVPLKPAAKGDPAVQAAVKKYHEDNDLPPLRIPGFSGSWTQGRFTPTQSGYTRDNSLGSDGRFHTGPGRLMPPSGLGYISDHESKHLYDRRQAAVDIKFDPPPPIKVEVLVTASSSLLQIASGAKDATLQLKGHVDRGPGGLGESGTDQ